MHAKAEHIPEATAEPHRDHRVARGPWASSHRHRGAQSAADVNRGALHNWRRAGLIRRERRRDSGCHERWRREPDRHKWCMGAAIDERLDRADRRLNLKNRVVIVGGIPQTTQPGLIGKTGKAQRGGERPNNDHRQDNKRKQGDVSSGLRPQSPTHEGILTEVT
jgi:hypothetical protein